MLMQSLCLPFSCFEDIHFPENYSGCNTTLDRHSVQVQNNIVSQSLNRAALRPPNLAAWLWSSMTINQHMPTSVLRLFCCPYAFRRA